MSLRSLNSKVKQKQKWYWITKNVYFKRSNFSTWWVFLSRNKVTFFIAGKVYNHFKELIFKWTIKIFFGNFVRNLYNDTAQRRNLFIMPFTWIVFFGLKKHVSFEGECLAKESKFDAIERLCVDKCLSVNLISGNFTIAS